MTVVSIMAVITALVLVRQSRFDSSTVLRSLAYSVALSVRQAQVYGSSVLGTTTTQAACSGNYNTSFGTCYAPAYGVYFSSNTANDLTGYKIFADLNNNGKYDAGEEIKTFAFNTGYSLVQFCVGGTDLSSSQPIQRCSPSTITYLSIVFKRPNPEATFVALQSDGNPPNSGNDSYATSTIKIQNLGDPTNTRTITITQTGEIAVCGTTSC
jgi:hypothetical protein